jgi:hypothetical protein
MGKKGPISRSHDPLVRVHSIALSVHSNVLVWVCVHVRANGHMARWRSIAIKIVIDRFLKLFSTKEGVSAIVRYIHDDR